MFSIDISTVFKTLLGIYLLFLREVLSVAVTEVRILSDSNRHEYVLAGEGVTLTCQYVLEPSEEVTEVEWEKDGILVYVWIVDSAPKAYDILEGNVDLSNKSPSILTILKANMDVEGSYTCRVRTNGKRAQNDGFLLVIIDACHENAWKTHTDMISCTESFNMHCVGMYPKPSPACGVYSETTGKYLNSVPFDSIISLPNKTYEVSFNRRFTIEEWINHTDISFRCYMLVLSTPWRNGIRHRMFGDPGCPKLPTTIAHGYYNMTDERSCWGYPAEGAKAEYHCNNDYQLLGSALHICKNGKWMPDGVVVEGDYEIPVCNNFAKTKLSAILFWMALTFATAKRWIS